MRPSRLLALILVVLVFPGVVWAQDTIYGCVKINNGQVRIVGATDKCLPSEKAITWQATAAAGAGTVITPTPGPLKVVDDLGAPVGFLVSGGNAAKLVGDLWLGFPIGPTGFSVADPAAFMAFYTLPSCAGDAYVPAESTTILRTGQVMPTGVGGALQFYYPGKPEVTNTAIQSYAAGGFCNPITIGPWMPLFGKLVILDLTFKAPFKIVQ